MTRPSILSHKLGSLLDEEFLCSGFIDKLEFTVAADKVSIKTLQQDVDMQTGTISIKGCFGITLFTTKLGTDVKALYNRSGLVYRLILNPSSISNWTIFSKSISPLWKYFSPDSIITRADLTIDIARDFKYLYKGIIITGKCSVTTHRKIVVTGLDIGKNEEIIKVYDRTKKAKLSFPCTRIEIALKGRKRPFKNITQMLDYFQNFSNAKNPFNIISLNYISIPDNKVCSKPSKTKSLQMKNLLELCSYMDIKNHFNSNNNFQREFGNIIFPIPSNLQPNEIFKVGILDFFKTNQNLTEF